VVVYRRGEPTGVVPRTRNPIKSAIVPRSRTYFLLIDDAVLEAAGAAIGDTVRVAFEPAGNTGGDG
jgi:hypothetical protein